MEQENPWIFVVDFDRNIGALILEAHYKDAPFEMRKWPQEGKLAPKSAIMMAREVLSEHAMSGIRRKNQEITQDVFAALDVMSEQEFNARIRSQGFIAFPCTSGGCPLPPDGDELDGVAPTQQP